MTTSTDAPRSAAGASLATLLIAACVGCTGPDAAQSTHPAPAGWSVTAWGERFEVFPEVGALIAGEAATAHTHVTRLDDFEPLAEGEVEIVLSGPGGEQVFAAAEPALPGIFHVELRPRQAGEFDLAVRIRAAAGSEEIRAGRVRVGDAAAPGGVLVAPAPRGGGDGGQPLRLLKEQQWSGGFATAWVRSGTLAGSVSGLATIRPPAGGEATIAAPVDGVVRPLGSTGWPFVGHRVETGQPLFRISPLVAADRSLPALAAELESLDTELDTARARLARLEELLGVDAVSRREVEEARARVETLAARRAAAERDFEAARSAREGGASAHDLILRAPFSGEVARVSATPGATVRAGDALARVVGSDLVWIEVEVPPGGARRLAGGVSGVSGVVLSDPEHGTLRIEDGVRSIAIAPEVSPRTGTVTVLLEAPRSAGLTLGATMEAQVLTAEPREGIVIPASALVDDGGVAVVYLQLSGESFVRQEVEIVERQGDRVLVERLAPGQRLVTRGGDAIRRASLTAAGAGHGHVH